MRLRSEAVRLLGLRVRMLPGDVHIFLFRKFVLYRSRPLRRADLYITNPGFCLHCVIMYSISFSQQTNLEFPIQHSSIRLAMEGYCSP